MSKTGAPNVDKEVQKDAGPKSAAAVKKPYPFWLGGELCFAAATNHDVREVAECQGWLRPSLPRARTPLT